jgi:hypothetical protein
MTTLNEEIMNQIRLMKYDRSKILSEQGLGAGFAGTNVSTTQISASAINELLTEDNIDTLISVISSALQVIPGIGTLAGTIIEALHGVSYFVRYFIESDESKKWEYFILGLIQFGLVFVPVPGGSPLIKTIKGKFKEVKMMTPSWLLKFLGLNTLTFLKPPSLKSLIWLFIKKMGINFSSGELASAISIFISKINKVCEKIEVVPNIDVVCKGLRWISKKINSGLSEFKDIENEANEIENSSISFDDASDFEIPVDKCLAYKKWDSSTDKSNAKTIQQLMIDLGHKISLDGDFGDETATAVGTYVYGYSKGVRSVDDLWKQMKNGGWGVGETTGYGPKMRVSVSQMLSNVIDTVKKKINC